MLKIEVAQLKKAVQWIEANTNDLSVQIYTSDGNKLLLKATDKMGHEVEITLYSDSQMLPKIKKTEVLK
jgi:hypothetical protein